jgi:hypothetical protein
MQRRARPAIGIAALPMGGTLSCVLAIVVGLRQWLEVGRLERHGWVIGKPELVMHVGALGRQAMSQQHLAPELAPGFGAVEWIVRHAAEE